MGSDKTEIIIELAQKRHLAEILYQKSPADAAPPPRVIEPYSISQGKQDIMIRGYQVEPDEGWRYFMKHKIVGVRDTGREFEPRRRITMDVKNIRQTFEPWAEWSEGVKMYRDAVMDILADMVVTDEERANADEMRRENGIGDEMMRSVHATIFSNCLTHILADGVVDEQERNQIKALHSCLRKLGWSVGD